MPLCEPSDVPGAQEAQTNFQILNYEQELQQLERVSAEELVLSLRRQSKGFSRGSSRFRGVTRHQKGRWEARIGMLVGRKYLYLGLFDSEEEGEAFNFGRAAVQGLNSRLTRCSPQRPSLTTAKLFAKRVWMLARTSSSAATPTFLRSASTTPTVPLMTAQPEPGRLRFRRPRAATARLHR